MVEPTSNPCDLPIEGTSDSNEGLGTRFDKDEIETLKELLSISCGVFKDREGIWCMGGTAHSDAFVDEAALLEKIFSA